MAGKDSGSVVRSAAKQDPPKREPAKRETPVPQYSPAAIVQQTLSGSAPIDPAKVLHLQRTIGNRAVGQLLEGRHRAIQTRLTVGAADDPYEREADRVASQVMSSSAPSDVARQEDDPTAQRSPAITPLVRRREDELDMHGSFDAGNDVERQISAGRSSGDPLPVRLRSELEPKFGTNFGNVRVHTGAQSDQLNRKLGAQAFTYSNHIYMADGKYSPGTGAGKHLLAHELTHVVQQTGRPAIQMKREDKPALLNMTVEAFDNHRKAEQMDWANDDAITDRERSIIWGIIDWGVSGLAGIKLSDIVSDAAAHPETLAYLKDYCQAINGMIDGQKAISLIAVNDLAEAKKQGKYVRLISDAVGSWLAKLTIPREVFVKLIAEDAVAEKFIEYYRACNPIMQTPTGEEVASFVILVKDEKADILSYRSPLPEIRNYHKFMKASLDKLVADKKKTDKPLTLILHSAFDHNGAFHRHAHVNKVIQSDKLVVLLLEGMDIERLRTLTKTGLADLASKHGMGGKITQIMVAGHGNSTSMEMGGRGVAPETVTEKDSKGVETKKDQVMPQGNVPVRFTKGNGYDEFWTNFFEAAFKNMGEQNGLQPRVLLRACLTNSNQVDTKKLKEEMKLTGTIDFDDKGVDPTTPENQIKIRAAIKQYIADNGSLATILGNKAGGRAKVLGANASITAESTGSIHEDSGVLDVIAQGDKKIAAPKIEYVREGKEPVGALKAVIEAWADNDVDCFAKMSERVKDVAADGEDFIIQLLYNTILASYKNDILTANGFVGTAGALAEVLHNGAECRVSELRGDALTQKHKGAFYPALMGSGFAGKNAKLVILQDWMAADIAKRKVFVDALGDGSFDRLSAKDYLDFVALAGHIDEIFKDGSASLKGRILLALIGFIEHEREDCKTFLRGLDVDNKLPLDVKNELKGYSQDRLRKNLGLPVEVAKSAPVVVNIGELPEALPSKNAVPSKGVNAYYVEPIGSTTKKMTKSKLFDWAKLHQAPDDTAPLIDSFYNEKDFTVVGEVKTQKGASLGWYMLRLDSGKVAYMRKQYF